MTDAPPVDPAQAITALMMIVAIIVGLFFRRYGRAAIAGVILGFVIVAVVVWGIVSSGSVSGDLYGTMGYITGRFLSTCVLGTLLGCLIHRGIARLFRRRDKPAPP